MFRFTTGDNSELHTATLQTFADASERLETSLTFDDVSARLDTLGWYDPVPDEVLSRALIQLETWGLLDVAQNHAEHYATAEDYERKHLQYSLTKRGEAAFAGVQHALATLASSGALQTAVLDAIADRIDELHRLLSDAQAPNRRIFTTLQELEGHLDALRNNTKQFNGELQRLLRAEGADLTTFHEVKGATVAYLQEFVTNLDHRRHSIAQAMARVEPHGISVLHHRALAGADLPPTLGTDPVPDWLAHRAARWDGLRAWFAPLDGTAPRVEQLHAVARRAIVSLLQVLDRITEARRRDSSGADDFRTLARWFAAADSDDEMHRLWNAAFGLWPSRHAHLEQADAELVPSSASWAQAPAVPVSPLLRKSGRTERFSRTASVRDTAALRKARQATARAERAELEAAWGRLATAGPVWLSTLHTLEHDGFQRLLELLGRALASAIDSTGQRRATTTDGQVEILIGDPRPGATATVHTPLGSFTGPDYAIDVRTVGADRRGRHRAEAAGEPT
jgi:uncharacterized protein (TIGR02677 family)